MICNVFTSRTLLTHESSLESRVVGSWCRSMNVIKETFFFYWESFGPWRTRLKYRLDTSIRNYIVTTIWRVHDISKSMPHLDSYATPLLHFTLRALRVVLFGRTSYTLVVYMRTEQVIRSYRADHACILIHALAHLVMARKTPSLSYEVYRSTGRLDYSWIQAENSEWKLCWMASFKQATL